jgi:hypothetical protein
METITAPAGMATGFLPPLRCDRDGNLYYRASPIDPIHKLNLKGEEIALFRAAAGTDKKIDVSVSYALTPQGGLYELVFPHEIHRYVFVYSPDGSFKSAIKLDPGFPFVPHALAVFASGQLLITGSEYDHDRAAAMWPFTGIFAADGRLLKEIKLDDDETLRDMAVDGDARVKSPTGANGNRAVDLSQIETAADGNAYLMRWTNPAVIYAISPGGEVVRRFKVNPGDSSYRVLDTIHVFQNRIAVFFVDEQTHDEIMKIVDLEGNEIATYDEPKAKGDVPDTVRGGAFACYTENPTRFVFLGASDDNRMQFWIAEPR